MKKILTILIITFSFISCNNRRERGYYEPVFGYSFFFSVENTAGENLLDSATVGNILDNEIYIAYQGERLGEKYENRYRVGDRPSKGFQLIIYQSGDDTSEYLQANLQANLLSNLPALIFYMPEGFFNKIFTINWGDSTSDEMKFEMYKTQDEEGKHVFSQKVWFNDELLQPSGKSLMFTIVK
jgi:hypothetical protein